MSRSVAVIWKSVPADLPDQLKHSVASGLARRADRAPALLFFRADDVGIPGAQLNRMLETFHCTGAPLSLAVVPAWLTLPRWTAIQAMARGSAPRWHWHQHGYRHYNHETCGKKQEFGPSRSPHQICHDLKAGRSRLAVITNGRCVDFFTPPWNRCSRETLVQLQRLGYQGISRSRGARPRSPQGLPHLPATLDLHTRRDPDSRSGWTQLLAQLSQDLCEGYCGVMLHHQRMNQAAHCFLELLLQVVVKNKDIRLVHLGQAAAAFSAGDF